MAITQESLANANFNALGMDEVVRDMTAVISAVNTPGLDELQYTEVAVSSAQILAMGSTPVTLLAAPGANKYYEYYGFIEYTAGATAYTFANDNIIIGDDDTYAGDYIALNLINSTIDHTAGFNSFAKGQELGYAGGPHVGYPVKINKALKLFTYNATNPTLGDGTFLVKIWYKVKTFGTEL